MPEIKIDPEFEALIPPLSAEEYGGLVTAILADGCRDSLVTWDGILVDGHNRFKICTQHGIDFQTCAVQFESRDAAMDWIDRNQISRRNITKNQRRMIMGRIYSRRKKAVGGQEGNQNAKRTGQNDPIVLTAEIIAAEFGVSASTVKRAAKDAEFIDAHPEVAKQVTNGEIELADAVREIKRAEVVANLEDIKVREVKALAGVYDTIVIDPPWDMQKIERDERPNQTAFDYPTMSEAELKAMTIPCAKDCHVWLWTTHKFLPMAFRLLDAWGLTYVCCFTWHKPGGFQPVGLPQYNCEFAIYARKGSPKFIDTKAFNTCFNAPRGRHSEKPEEFYDVVRRVTAGRRLDMFNRREIEGFETFGNEAA
jgi:N6-adenosine-specific RNA methylase IME4